MFFANSYYYYISIALQVICVIHCLRKGNATWWIWLIVFLPFVGCLAYLYMEMFANKRSNMIPKINVADVINPSAKIKKLEDNVRFSDTFANKIKLADAYLAASQTEKAIAIYEGSLKGAFEDNEHVIGQLLKAYFERERFADVITFAQKIYKSQRFAKSPAHLLYALALEKTGQTEQAEREFKLMKGRYSCFEQRYEYGKFLTRAGRTEEARKIYTDILDEIPHLGPIEKKSGKTWFGKAKEELKAL